MNFSLEAVILAAGEGSRLRPLTLTTPKPLIPINGVPLLLRLLRNLNQIDLDRIWIVVGHENKKVRQFVMMQKDIKLNYRFVLQKVLSSSEQAFHIGMKHTTSDLVLCLCSDDLVTAEHVRRLLDAITSNADCAFLTKKVIDPNVSSVQVNTDRRIVHCSNDTASPIIIYNFIIRRNLYRYLIKDRYVQDVPLVRLIEPFLESKHFTGVDADDLITVNTLADLLNATEYCARLEGRHINDL